MQLYVLKAYWRKLVVLNIAQGRILLRSFQPGTYRIRFLIQLFDPSAHEEVTREKNPWKFPKRNNTVQYPASAVGLTLSFGNPKSGAKEESVDMDISDDAQQLLAGRSLYSELFDGTEAAMSFSLPEHSLASSGPAIRVQREKHWTKYREAGWIALQSHQFEIPGGTEKEDKLLVFQKFNDDPAGWGCWRFGGVCFEDMGSHPLSVSSESVLSTPNVSDLANPIPCEEISFDPSLTDSLSLHY